MFIIYVAFVALVTAAYCAFLIWAMQADDRAADEPLLMRALFWFARRLFRAHPKDIANHAWGQS